MYCLNYNKMKKEIFLSEPSRRHDSLNEAVEEIEKMEKVKKYLENNIFNITDSEDEMDNDYSIVSEPLESVRKRSLCLLM